MSSEKSLTPQIRFKGFTEAWEQRKLGELATFNPNADLPAQFEYVDLESVAGTEMLSHRTEIRDSAPSRAQRLAQFGDLFYQTVRPYQKNNYLYEKPDNNYVFSTGYAQMRPLVDGYFLLSLVQNEGFIKKVLDNCSGTSYPAINANVLSSIVVNSSSHRKEQIQVGYLFRRIDNLITLHQRKLDALKKIKSALLEKMFPKDGSDIPEIRFAGFTEAWEQRKAIDLFKDVSEKGFDNLPVLSATQDRGMVYRDENGINISHDKKNELTYKHVIPGQFVIHLRSFQGGFAHSAIEGITSPAYTVFKFSNASQHDDIFWKYIFMSERFIKSLETVTYGIRDGRSISYSEFLGLPFAVPEKEEESCIGYFLKKYDSLITLHQRKLDALKKIKSALLEKMFV